MNKFNVEKIKLVIWDLDDTFWKGTISEEEVGAIDENIESVKLLTDCGIINSICSKNDYDVAREKLVQLGVWDYFVCPSINWESKGERVKELISDLQLRDANVLFIDDNSANLNEVEYYNKNIMTASPDELTELYDGIRSLPKSDLQHKRLERYKIIETKIHKRQEIGSNLEFLKDSNIKVEIRNNCLEEAERLYELMQRTNQLNYTKKRPTFDEFFADIKNEDYKCGYVHVEDNYGDYGIVGFYCLGQSGLVHYFFSCRCMGMGVEQYVYSELNYPELEVVGEVTVALKKGVRPEWINIADRSDEKKQNVIDHDVKVLFKGPCDMFQLFSFIKETENIDHEFTYNSPTGVSIEQRNHTQCILQSLDITQERIDEISSELPFGDKDMFTQYMFEKEYDIIFFSTFTDCGLGVYRRKTGEYVAFGEYVHPLTDEAQWQGYIDMKVPTSHCRFTREQLQYIKDNYEFVGRPSTDEILDNIKTMFGKLSENTRLVLLLGPELPYLKNKNSNYNNRHLFYKELNDKIKEYAKNNERVDYIEFSRYVKSQKDFFNSINHFMKNIYYEVAQEMIEYMSRKTRLVLERKDRSSVFKPYIKQCIKKLLGTKWYRIFISKK